MNKGMETFQGRLANYRKEDVLLNLSTSIFAKSVLISCCKSSSIRVGNPVNTRLHVAIFQAYRSEGVD